MSLNFVSTSVLSSTDGVSHNTETDLKPKDSSSLNLTHGKPLYEQLRENAQKDQEKYDEISKAMRGTATLDDGDVAYLNSIEARKEEMKNDGMRKIEEEIQRFRAARLEKSVAKNEITQEDSTFEDEKIAKAPEGESEALEYNGKKASIIMKPKIIKRRRRKVALNQTGKEMKKQKVTENKAAKDVSKGARSSELKNQRHPSNNNSCSSNDGALAGLLAYGSDSDSD